MKEKHTWQLDAFPRRSRCVLARCRSGCRMSIQRLVSLVILVGP